VFIAGDYSLSGHRRDRVGVATMLGILFSSTLWHASNEGNRRDERYPITVKVEVMIPGFWMKSNGSCVRTTCAIAECSWNVRDSSARQSVLNLRFVSLGQWVVVAPPAVVRARVVHVTRDALAVVFIPL